MRSKHLIAILILLALVVPSSPTHAGVVSVCDEAPPLAALAGGGTTTFRCCSTITLGDLLDLQGKQKDPATYPRPLPGWAAYGAQPGAGFGSAVSVAGDVNGDGYSDVVVGAFTYDHGETDEGAAFLFLGSANGLASAPAWMSESNQSGSQFGLAVSTAGDVNSDGYSDVIVGARSFTDSFVRGKAYLFYGSAAGLAPTPGWTAVGETPFAYFGQVVASAGDVNGDGYDDVVVGSHGFDGGRGFPLHMLSDCSPLK